MKFGVYLPVYGGWLRRVTGEEPEVSFSHVLKVAQEAERLGFHSLWCPDHMLNPIKGDGEPCLEAWTTITAVAMATKRIRLAHTTLCQAFRYPAVLAKMAATLDQVSGGRFILSVGAGWFRREFDAYGIPWAEHDVLIDQAEEQMRLIKALWTQEKVNFQGKYYHLQDALLEPKPVQKPRPPVWYGGESERSRQAAAREADCWLMRGGSLEDTRAKIQDMQGRLQGRKIEYALPALVFLGPDDAQAENKLRETSQGQASVLDHVLKTGLVGSGPRLVEKIRALEALGISYILLQFSQTLAGIRLFAQEVVARL